MSFLFQSISTQLSSERQVKIEPILSLGINTQGWHNAGVYNIHSENNMIGKIAFEGNQWHYDGLLLNEVEQEELAYFIRFYEGRVA